MAGQEQVRAQRRDDGPEDTPGADVSQGTASKAALDSDVDSVLEKGGQ